MTPHDMFYIPISPEAYEYRKQVEAADKRVFDAEVAKYRAEVALAQAEVELAQAEAALAQSERENDAYRAYIRNLGYDPDEILRRYGMTEAQGPKDN